MCACVCEGSKCVRAHVCVVEDAVNGNNCPWLSFQFISLVVHPILCLVFPFGKQVL